MEDDFKLSLLSVCKIFENHSIEYMIIGGTAVAYYGYYRASTNMDGTISGKPDIDVWYNPTYENYFKLINAIENLGKDVTKYRTERSPNPKKSFFKLELPDFTLDLLPETRSAITYSKASLKKEIIQLDGININFISLDDLIEDKKSSGRKKDIEDINELKSLNESD
ncbi:hypothetical protein SAMN05421866_0244 [Chryseobacterium oranimense]|uniref:Nucleotidyl transferase AbiEii toxin, Type IV TA system n=1 Tax=Chryseobacterium oranimense TaxID=421058 RepID=A0A1M5JCF7_9FLAO|nr:hypothetical protein [Chryseobacterium oranimense]SHG38286.1 hypothetical protein SAMN05421866_0244 [Chryseobacterium oranimense]